MSFRRRIVLLASVAVAAAVILASIVVYVATGQELRKQLDATLQQKLTPGQPQSVQIKTTSLSAGDRRHLEEAVLALQRAARRLGGIPAPNAVFGYASPGLPVPHLQATVKASPSSVPESGGPVRVAQAKGPGPAGGLGLFNSITRGPHGTSNAVSVVLPAQGPGGASGYAQLVEPDGRVVRSSGPGAGLPVTPAVRAVAAGRRPGFFSNATISGTPVRVLTRRAPQGGVVQLALPLTDVDNTLKNLLLVLAGVSLAGVLIAALLGLVVSRAALVPVRRLTGATERVARTQDLAHRIPAGGDDEIGRLAESFNTMLAALERSRLSQRQLISDASHELRTPLTSVKANLDALSHGESLTPQERARAVAAAQAQLQELTVLVGDLVDLSKTEVDQLEVEDVRLDLAVAGAIERARLHAPECSFSLESSPCMVRGAPSKLDRAVANMLDNAIKWGPPEGPIEVRVQDGRVEVRDHGPGIDPEALARVFDRFYRAPAARRLPGSGLGLAIVRQVAETHGGSVHASNDPGGGARLVLELPTLPMSARELSGAGDPEFQQVPPVR